MGSAAGSSYGSGVSFSDSDWMGKVGIPRSSVRGGPVDEEEEDNEDQETVEGSDDWEREGMPPARGHIQQLQWTKDTVTVTWRAYADGDPACCATQEFTGNLTLDGDTPHLAVTGHRQVAG